MNVGGKEMENQQMQMNMILMLKWMLQEQRAMSKVAAQWNSSCNDTGSLTEKTYLATYGTIRQRCYATIMLTSTILASKIG